MVVVDFIVPSGSSQRLSTIGFGPAVVIVVTSTLPSHVLVKTRSIHPFGPSIGFFDGVPSSMYTVDSEFPAIVRVTVILLPSTVITHCVKLSGDFHLPAKSALSCADTPVMQAIARTAERSARFIFIAPYLPTAIRWNGVRKYQVPSPSAEDVSTGSFTLFTCSSSNVLPASTTNLSPPSSVKNSFPSPATGDAEKPLCTTSPRRPCHSKVPDFASYAVRMLAWSLSMYSSSP